MTRKLFQGTLLILLVNLAVAWVFIAPANGEAINGEILQQQLTDGTGYTVMKVWGTYYEMGYAHGYLLADDIDSVVESFSNAMSPNFDDIQLRSQIMATAMPDDMVDEINGMVAGIKAVNSSSSVDFGDILMLNTYPDWAYSPNCRSHMCWGSYVTAPVKTLSTRRTDYGNDTVDLLFDSLNIITVAYAPSDMSKMKWVSLGTPGLIIGGTAVNEYGVLVSLHDSPDHGGGAHAIGPDVITRSITSRYMVTCGLLQVDYMYDILQSVDAWTGGFINYYAPEGKGGVFSLSAADSFFYLRKPQPEYYGGEVLVTANTNTDGKSTPIDFDELGDYYDNTSPKTLLSHWNLLDKVDSSKGAQMMSVAYREHEDMTIWVRGRLFGTNATPRIELEWSELFAASTPPVPIDNDGDGYDVPEDCDDNDPLINPSATEVCDSVDNDCDGATDEGFDNDNDGYTTCNGDCNDSDSNVNPSANEICDYKDNDCDGLTDEGVMGTYYRDADGDSYGDINSTTEVCSAPTGYVSNSADCDDTNPSINPTVAEVCDDGIDNDCDGAIDADDSECGAKEGCGADPMYRDNTPTTSSGKAVLPLLPSILALGVWRFRGRRKSR